MKKIYIILTYTGTILSKIIKCYTGDEFSHVSIALDPQLKKMYSFGRLNPYNPFWGGFVHERVNSGTFKRFSKTRARIYSLEVEDEQYEKLTNAIMYIKQLRRYYRFNILGLFAVGFNIKIRADKSFYCAEFVKYVLEQAKIETSLPELIRPDNFKQIENLKEEYDGLLKLYEFNKKVIGDRSSNPYFNSHYLK